MLGYKYVNTSTGQNALWHWNSPAYWSRYCNMVHYPTDVRINLWIDLNPDGTRSYLYIPWGVFKSEIICAIYHISTTKYSLGMSIYRNHTTLSRSCKISWPSVLGLRLASLVGLVNYQYTILCKHHSWYDHHDWWRPYQSYRDSAPG